jgi:copper(I)-binding protein
MRHSVHLIITLLLAVYVGSAAHGQTSAANTIVVEQPWARATPGGAKTGAAYMTLINNGRSVDRLLGATTPLADKVQFHKETEDDGVSRMRQVQSMELEPGAKIIFKPGELHVMIVGLKQPLTEGQTFPLTLQFEKASNIEVTVPIEKIGAMQHKDMGSMAHRPEDAMKK